MADSSGSPTWIEISVLANAESVESVAELFSRYGYNEGVVIEEAYRQDGDGENLEVDPTRPVTVRTFLHDDIDAPGRRKSIDEGLWHLRQLGEVGEIVERVIREDDWESAWKQHFPVLRIGKRFVIKPTWQEHQATGDDLVIHLDPGMAFGTGSHPTTEMCLLALEEIDCDGLAVLDAGAGSGILTVAACLLGAATVDAIELDPYAGTALEKNLELNDVADRSTVIVGSVGSSVPDGHTYDLILANIIARVHIEDAPTFGSVLAPHGRMIASGIISEREREVLDAFAGVGLSVERRMTVGDWVTLVLHRSLA
ncbi:MAG: 50S ribosomal protein L11 methyltransferase [Thermomicrobiales bacterium]